MELNCATKDSDDSGEVIRTLTKKLEQAAEQLDRLQRNGKSEGRTESGHAEHQTQHALIEHVDYLVNQWDISQLPASVGRIETQISELRDLIVQAGSQSPGIPANQDTAHESFRPDSSLSSYSQSAAESTYDDVELLKTLQEALAHQEFDGSEEAQTNADSTGEEGGVDPESLQLDKLPEPPEYIDVDSSTNAELIAAIDERNRYIKTIVDMHREFRRISGLVDPVPWDQIAEQPEEIKTRLEKLQEQLEEQLRINEVSLSLERARLSRESTLLNQSRIQLEKFLKKTGIKINRLDDLDNLSDDEASQLERGPQKGQKWLNLLRLKD